MVSAIAKTIAQLGSAGLEADRESSRNGTPGQARHATFPYGGIEPYLTDGYSGDLRCENHHRSYAVTETAATSVVLASCLGGFADVNLEK